MPYLISLELLREVCVVACIQEGLTTWGECSHASLAGNKLGPW